jgi:hypothetical protein
VAREFKDARAVKDMNLGQRHDGSELPCQLPGKTRASGKRVVGILSATGRCVEMLWTLTLHKTHDGAYLPASLPCQQPMRPMPVSTLKLIAPPAKASASAALETVAINRR